jgi:hypothetical protein
LYASAQSLDFLDLAKNLSFLDWKLKKRITKGFMSERPEAFLVSKRYGTETTLADFRRLC